MSVFRIHGDNIVECERIARLIQEELNPHTFSTSLISPSTINIEMNFTYLGTEHFWRLELLPGFNKSGRHRWQDNIFRTLKRNGSFLDETPDAIITKVENESETILFAVEFCSALQAGNQAWQRSGRAFSTGRAGCPYLYIVDFVKYELDSRTRARKALRFPNPAVPYSYINFTKNTEIFVAQVYIKSEEFDKSKDRSLVSFDEDDFGENELKEYIIRKMLGIDTDEVEETILRKNMNVVLFLSNGSNPNTNFTQQQWIDLYNSPLDIIDFANENSTFNFHKTITARGHHGKSEDVLSLIDGVSVGLASRDLPFGIIPANQRPAFARGLKRLYPEFNDDTIALIASTNKHLVLCLIKGFKPRGDDNRPDRGLLPLATMLSATDVEVMTYLYGPVIYNNYVRLLNEPHRLANANGLWKSILALSNYVALDVPILSGPILDACALVNTTTLKNEYSARDDLNNTLTQRLFSSVPTEYHEDDVDTGIHFLFSHIMKRYCFEGMCNPPGGDWSGFSVIHNNKEYRWLSLPRVSGDIDGKRPDHIIELFDVFEKPLLLSIESKEKSFDLETDVGSGLKNYIRSLMDYIPNVERDFIPTIGNWERSDQYLEFSSFETISAAAYLKSTSQRNDIVFEHSNCDMLFILEPRECGWNIEIVTSSRKTEILKSYLLGRAYSPYITLS